MSTGNNVVTGPKAPKDPNKKTQAFYIMRGKEVCGSPTADGRGIQFIYEDGGRLINSAKLVGNIEDQAMLDLMLTTAGFRKLVHSIGVTVETEDASEVVTFAFQHYGKTDPYVSGSTHTLEVSGDGMESIMVLDELEWSDDDNCPGQIRFEFKKPGTLAKVAVKFYLNDGFTAPAVEEDKDVDFESDEYKEMISWSLMNKGNNARIKTAIDKARRGEDVTLGFIGGSITQGAGAIPINTKCYARRIFEGFCDVSGRGYEDNVHYVKAGMGGTPSELGMIRYERDITKDGEISPDLVVVEFAVNDAGDETNGRCFDSLVRKIYNSPSKPAVVILFAVFQDDFNLQDRLSPVGEAYDIPMVSTKNSVSKQFYLKPGQGRVISKGQYFYDCFHPTNTGHKVMADGVIKLFEVCDEQPYDKEIESLNSIKAPIGGEFENVHLIDRADNKIGAVIDAGSFTSYDKDIQSVELNMDTHTSPMFPNNWKFDPKEGTYKPFEMDIEASKLLIVYKDSASPEFGTVDVFVDGVKSITIDPHVVGWTHANAYIVFENDEVKNRHVSVRMKDGDEDKAFTILGFGYVR
ncbi:MAG: SGNH/GDSL hydrolase family protein [Lachnospiraceae bacterium]|nr:SGNH/GDSL hydrolase family protein [Lachnospiraceae bacterium]